MLLQRGLSVVCKLKKKNQTKEQTASNSKFEDRGGYEKVPKSFRLSFDDDQFGFCVKKTESGIYEINISR